MSAETHYLLPVGSQIDHNGQPLKITRRLSSSGWTSEVYAGELLAEGRATPVAIKVMKMLDMPMARKLFEGEGVTLATMTYHEEEANKQQRLSLRVVPVYYGSAEYGGLPYLVMEFIQGIEVPKLLESRGRLPEPQALTIAWHLYRTLDLLHTRLKKTYIDLKFEDLWWVEGANGEPGQLKLTDFGTLEDIKGEDTRGVRRDLLLAGVYLCGLLTGHMLNYSLGELLERAEPFLRSAEISWGARNLLRRLLHRNPDLRPNSAAVVAAELRSLVNFWDQNNTRLFEIAENNLARAEEEKDTSSPKVREYAGRARASLDVIRFHPPYDEGRWRSAVSRAEDRLSLSNYLERGQALFDGQSYQSAREVFEEGMQWSEDPSPLRRWAYLARVGQDIPSEIFSAHRADAVQALNRLNENDLPASLARFESLEPALVSPGLLALKADTQLFLKLQEAETAWKRQDFRACADAYREAQRHLNNLPDAGFVRQEEVGDILKNQEEAGRLARTRQAARDAMDEAIAKLRDDEEHAIGLAWQAYDLDREDRLVRDRRNTLLVTALELRKYPAAMHIAEIGERDYPPDPILANGRSLAVALWGAEQALLAGDTTRLVDAIDRVRTTPEFMVAPTTPAALQDLVQRAGERANEARNEAALLALAGLCDRLGDAPYLEWAGRFRADASAARSTLDDEMRRNVDRLVMLATHLEAFDEPEYAQELNASGSLADFMVVRRQRLQEAHRLLADAERIALPLDFRADEIHELQARVTGKMAEPPTDGSQSSGQREQALAALQAEWEKLHGLQAWSQAQSLEDQPAVRAEINHVLRGRLLQYIQQVYAFLEKYGEANLGFHDRLQWAFAALDGAGEGGWQELAQAAAAGLERVRNELSVVKQRFEAGDLVFASAEMDRLEPRYKTLPEWQVIRARLRQALLWDEWQRANAERLESGQYDPALLATLRKFACAPIPAVYLQSSLVKAYFQKLWQARREEVKNGLPDRTSAVFVKSLKKWLDIKQTTSLFNEVGKHVAS